MVCTKASLSDEKALSNFLIQNLRATNYGNLQVYSRFLNQEFSRITKNLHDKKIGSFLALKPETFDSKVEG